MILSGFNSHLHVYRDDLVVDPSKKKFHMHGLQNIAVEKFGAFNQSFHILPKIGTSLPHYPPPPPPPLFTFSSFLSPPILLSFPLISPSYCSFPSGRFLFLLLSVFFFAIYPFSFPSLYSFPYFHHPSFLPLHLSICPPFFFLSFPLSFLSPIFLLMVSRFPFKLPLSSLYRLLYFFSSFFPPHLLTSLFFMLALPPSVLQTYS